MNADEEAHKTPPRPGKCQTSTRVRTIWLAGGSVGGALCANVAKTLIRPERQPRAGSGSIAILAPFTPACRHRRASAELWPRRLARSVAVATSAPRPSGLATRTQRKIRPSVGSRARAAARDRASPRRSTAALASRAGVSTAVARARGASAEGSAGLPADYGSDGAVADGFVAARNARSLDRRFGRPT